MGSESKLYIRSICIADIILFPTLGIEVERVNLTWCIVILDMFVCLLIVGNYLYIRHYSVREESEVDKAGVQVTDFSIRLKNLPEPTEFKSLIMLRVKLEQHIRLAVETQPQVFDTLIFKDAEGIPTCDHTEIVNIRFGMKDF